MKRIFATLLAVALLSGCGQGLREKELDATNFDAATLHKMEKESGVGLPAGAKGLNYYYKPPIDPIHIARIEIPAASRDEMVARLSALPRNPINTSGGPTDRLAWWHPETETVLVERISSNDRGTYHRAVLTEKDGALTLFLHVSY